VGRETFLSDDLLFGVELVDDSLKHPSYPHFDGHADYISPTTGKWLGSTRYWARPYMRSTGTLTYQGRRFPVEGKAWQDRQWRGVNVNDDGVAWNWASIQLDDGQTLAAFDIWEKSSGLPVTSTLNIEGRPPACQSELLADPADWELQQSGAWTSPLSGVTYHTAFRLVVPSKQIDLRITPVHEEQEVTSAVPFFPGGSWEGAATVEGTVGGRAVRGRAYVEQLNKD
jgi:predicted secreted hydrolase